MPGHGSIKTTETYTHLSTSQISKLQNSSNSLRQIIILPLSIENNLQQKSLIMKIYKLFVGIILCYCTLSTTSVFAQNGDQILDGIGETELIARYKFEGNVKDWSRNNLHGSIQGGNFKFVDDNLFGNVLSLPEDSKAFISIPGESVTGGESISITGWIFFSF